MVSLFSDVFFNGDLVDIVLTIDGDFTIYDVDFYFSGYEKWEDGYLGLVLQEFEGDSTTKKKMMVVIYLLEDIWWDRLRLLKESWRDISNYPKSLASLGITSGMPPKKC